MKRTITQSPNWRCTPPGNRRWQMLTAILSVMSFLLLFPVSVWAEGDASEVTTPTDDESIFTYRISPITAKKIFITGLKEGVSVSEITIPATIDEKEVETIDKRAFYGNSTIKKVTFAENSKVTTIDSAAFGNSSVGDITLPTSLKTIQYDAFVNDRALSKIDIPASVTSIYPQAFACCTSLEKVTFAEDSKLTTINDAAFLYTALRSINIPASVTRIGDYAFRYCENLWSITFGRHSKLSYIGSYAFDETIITNFNIPETVENIQPWAFTVKDLANTTVTFNRVPSDVNSIANYDHNMFGSPIPNIIVRIGYEDAYRTQLRLTGDNANKVVGVEQREFEENGLRYLLNATKDGVILVELMEDIDADFEIPAKISTNNLPVTGVSHAFENNQTIKSVVIPASVISLDYAFKNSSLEKVTFAEGSKLDTIGREAFYHTPLTEITIPASTTIIHWYAFEGCTSLAKVTFAEGSKLKEIRSRAFYQCSALTEITIPTSVKQIDNIAFTDTGLKVVTMESEYPCTLSTDYLFGLLENISTVFYVPANSLDKYKKADKWDYYASRIVVNPITAFEYTVSADDKVTINGFKGSYFTEDLVLPEFIDGKTVTAIADEAFYTGRTDNLIKTLYVPASVETIGNKAFGTANMTGSLTSITFAPDSKLKSIGNSAFNKSLITSINIPASVETIGVSAFASLTLEKVRFLGAKAVLDEKTFDNLSALKFISTGAGNYDFYANQSFDKKELLVNIAEQAVPLTDNGMPTEYKSYYFNVGDMSYNRNLPAASQFATLCLPFDISSEQLSDAFESVYVPMSQMIHLTPKGGDDKFILMLEELPIGEVLAANTPVIAKMKDGKEALSFSNFKDMIMLSDVAPATTKLTVIDWDGTSGLMKKNTNYDISCSSAYQPQNASSLTGLYTFNTDGSFGPQTSGIYRPFRLALTIKDNAAGGDGQAKAYNITIGMSDGSTTGIRELSASKANGATSAMNSAVYNLSGNKVGTAAQLNQLAKGVYILNGKKIVIR